MRPKTCYCQQQSSQNPIFPSQARDQSLTRGARNETERLLLRALLLAVTSLWPHQVGSRNEIYSARWKLTPISDQAKDLVKNCLEGGGCMSPFQPLVYTGDFE